MNDNRIIGDCHNADYDQYQFGISCFNLKGWFDIGAKYGKLISYNP